MGGIDRRIGIGRRIVIPIILTQAVYLKNN
jgi:hypothetical protein